MFWRMWAIYGISWSRCRTCLPKASLRGASLLEKRLGLFDWPLSEYLLDPDTEKMVRSEVGSNTNGGAFRRRWKCSLSARFLSFFSFKSSSVIQAHSPGGFDWTAKPHPQLHKLTGDWSIKASIPWTDEPANGAYTDLFRVRSWFKEGGLPLEHTFEGNSTYIHISMLPSLLPPPRLHTHILFSLPLLLPLFLHPFMR